MYWAPWMRVLIDRTFPKEQLLLIHHEIQTLFLCNYQLNLFQVLNGKTFCRRGILGLSIDFVPCVEIFIVRKSQTTVISFDTFPIFQLIVLHDHWLNFLLQGLFPELHLLDGLLGFEVIEVVLRVGIAIVRVRRNALNIDKSLYSNSYFSVTTDLTHSTKIANENFSLSKKYWVWKTTKAIPALQSW